MENSMKSLLESTLNTRELGGYAFPGGTTREGRILRSDRICQPTEGDISFLLERGITTVIDLRTDEDAAESPCGLTEDRGFIYYHLPIVEGGSVPEHYRDMVPSYLAIARAPSMPAVFRTMAAAPEGIIFNCWAGKDRTGVTSAILLMLCGVGDEDIIDNYMLTGPYSEKLWEMIRLYRSPMEMRIILPDRHFIEGFLEGFKKEYGTAEGYLRGLGLSDGEIRAIRGKLCG